MKAYKLVQKGWCQDAFALDAEGKPVSSRSRKAIAWCALGALCRVYMSNDNDRLEQAMKELRLQLPGKHSTISSWNDAPERTQAEVVTMLRELDL